MEFPLEDLAQAALLAREGAVVVNIPSPARFAAHKPLMHGGARETSGPKQTRISSRRPHSSSISRPTGRKSSAQRGAMRCASSILQCGDSTSSLLEATRRAGVNESSVTKGSARCRQLRPRHGDRERAWTARCAPGAIESGQCLRPRVSHQGIAARRRNADAQLGQSQECRERESNSHGVATGGF